jgi:hypothetical protein
LGHDLKTGQVIWQGAEQDSFKRGGLLVYPEGERLQVYDPYDGFFVTIQAKSLVENTNTILTKNKR